MSKTYENAVNLLNARIAKLVQLEKHNQVKNVRANIKAFSIGCANVLAKHKIDCAFFEHTPETTREKEQAYSKCIADKTLTKVRQILNALASNNAGQLDGYTRAILANMVHLNGDISNKECHATISNEGNHEEGTLRGIRVRMGKGASTATAQAPTTRHALVKLGVCDYDEGARVLSFRDSKIAEEVRELFS